MVLSTRLRNRLIAVAGVWPVCDGHTGRDIVKGKKYTDRKCDRFLWSDLSRLKRAWMGWLKFLSVKDRSLCLAEGKDDL